MMTLLKSTLSIGEKKIASPSERDFDNNIYLKISRSAREKVINSKTFRVLRYIVNYIE